MAILKTDLRRRKLEYVSIAMPLFEKLSKRHLRHWVKKSREFKLKQMVQHKVHLIPMLQNALI